MGLALLWFFLCPISSYSQQNPWSSSQNLFFCPTPFKLDNSWGENNPAGYSNINSIGFTAVNYFGIPELTEVGVTGNFHNKHLYLSSTIKRSNLIGLRYSEGSISIGKDLTKSLKLGIQGGAWNKIGIESKQTTLPFFKIGLNHDNLGFQYGLVIGGQIISTHQSTKYKIPYSAGIKYTFYDSFGLGLIQGTDEMGNQGTFLNVSLNEKSNHGLKINIGLNNYNFSASYCFGGARLNIVTTLYFINLMGTNQSASTTLIL